MCEDLSKDRRPAAEAGVTAGGTHGQPEMASARKPAGLQESASHCESGLNHLSQLSFIGAMIRKKII